MKTILIVDDSALARQLAGECAQENGFAPYYAGNGREALKAIERHRPDIVLTDLQMPEMDGLELVGRIRQDFADVPVVLMTAYGSEAVAAGALKAGAASYVSKQNLERDLTDALRTMQVAIEARAQRDKVRGILERSRSKFILGCDPEASMALVTHLQVGLAQLNFCDDTGLFQVTTALTEALANAIDHGNLELDSDLRESGQYFKLRVARSQEPPYCERRVHVDVDLAPGEVTYVVRDEGSGFDPSGLPDPDDPENLLRASGRGVTLIRMFMDDVSFNDTGNEVTMVKRREMDRTPSDDTRNGHTIAERREMIRVPSDDVRDEVTIVER